MRPKILILTAMAALFTSCASKESVQVMFIHAASGSGNADVYFQEYAQAAGIAPGESAGYFTVEKKETYSGEILSTASGMPLARISSPAWESGKRYTVILFGNNNRLTKELFGDSYPAPASGKANLRFMHFAPDMPEVDVFLDKEQLFQNVSYYGDNIFNGARPFTQVRAGGLHTIEIRSPGVPVTSFKRSFTLEPGNTYTLFTCGNAKASSKTGAFEMHLVLH